jgi:hypothetical protein
VYAPQHGGDGQWVQLPRTEGTFLKHVPIHVVRAESWHHALVATLQRASYAAEIWVSRPHHSSNAACSLCVIHDDHCAPRSFYSILFMHVVSPATIGLQMFVSCQVTASRIFSKGIRRRYQNTYSSLQPLPSPFHPTCRPHLPPPTVPQERQLPVNNSCRCPH